MGQDGETYQKTVDDRAIILNARAYYWQPWIITAPDWTDLRCGFFLSLTDDVGDDLTTGLAETIANTGRLSTTDRYWLGVRGGTVGGGVFIGFVNSIERFPNILGDTVLASSDAGVGTTNTKFWRPANSNNNAWGAAIYDGYNIMPRAHIQDNNQIHFPQDAPTVAAGYAVLLGIQLLRDSVDSKTLTVRIKSAPKSADWIYSNAPTKELIQQTMVTWPASAQMGPVSLSDVPNSFYFYWPFRNSRLRVHSLGLVRAA